MKILFLDVDGVLNSNSWNREHESEIQEGILIDESKIFLLKEIIQKTDAKIILHSGWRFWFDENLNPKNKEAGIFKGLMQGSQLEIMGVTPDFTNDEVRKTKKFSLVKAKEILSWLETNAGIYSWIVLEDLDLGNDIVRDNQIKTDPEVGLTKEDVKTAILRLNN